MATRNALYCALGGVLLAIVLLAFQAVTVERRTHAAEAAAPVCTGNLLCLDQGWSDSERWWWYEVSQGSRLIPARWLQALEDPSRPFEKPEPFLSTRNLERWGYITLPSYKDAYGLPLGFVIDEDKSERADIMCDSFPESCKGLLMRQKWVGMTCAACHTNIIEFGGKGVLVEGAPTLADFQTFLDDLHAALDAVLQNEARFNRFASATLDDASQDAARRQLRAQLAEQIAWERKLARANQSRVRYGHARLDAQGYILNKVTATTRVADEGPAVPAEAPASYPTIWNASQLAQIQWNGIAQNYRSDPAAQYQTDMGALIRNTSEVIGVFAHIETDKRQAAEGYPSSIRFENLVEMENLLARLKSPRWPEDVLGPIDREKAERGKALFEKAECASCHVPLAWDDVTSKVKTHMVPLADIRTDGALVCNTFFHRSKAGHFAGQKVYFHMKKVPLSIAEEDFTRNMLTNTILGAMRNDPVIGGVFNIPEPPASTDSPPPAPPAQPAAGAAPTPPAGGALSPAATPASAPASSAMAPSANEPAKTLAQKCLETKHGLLAYKARPLNGIWTSAPYLHNGSVPTLYDLFLPSKSVLAGTQGAGAQAQTRPDVFGVGSRQFDAKKVGFISDPAVSPTIFRVTDEKTGEPLPGNSNAGHPFGTTLTEAERYDLIEYLKTF